MGMNRDVRIVLAAKTDQIDQQVSAGENRLQHLGLAPRQAAVPTAGSEKDRFKVFLQKIRYREIPAHGLVETGFDPHFQNAFDIPIQDVVGQAIAGNGAAQQAAHLGPRFVNNR